MKKVKQATVRRKVELMKEIKKVLSKYKDVDAESKFDILNNVAQPLRSKF